MSVIVIMVAADVRRRLWLFVVADQVPPDAIQALAERHRARRRLVRALLRPGRPAKSGEAYRD